MPKEDVNLKQQAVQANQIFLKYKFLSGSPLQRLTYALHSLNIFFKKDKNTCRLSSIC